MERKKYFNVHQTGFREFHADRKIHKANADARSQFCHFLLCRLVILTNKKTRLNRSKLISFVI